MKRLITLMLLCFSICLSLVGCSKQESSAPLRFGLLSIDDSLPFFMAQELGLFEKHGVEVELIPFGSAADKEAALEAGQLDADMTDLVVTALLKKGGTNVRIVSVALGAQPSEGRFALLSAPGSGITQFSQLAGIPVAVGENTIVHYLNYTILSAAGLSEEEILTQNIPNLSLRYEALLNGSVSATVLPDPLASLAAMNGAHVVYDDTTGEDNLSQSVVIFTQTSLNTRREDISKAMAAYYEAMTYINQHPQAEEVRLAISTFTNVPESIFDSYSTPSFTPGALPEEAVLADTMEWMVAEGLLEEAYSYEDLVDESFGYHG